MTRMVLALMLSAISTAFLAPLTAGGLPIRIADPDELHPSPKQTVA